MSTEASEPRKGIKPGTTPLKDLKKNGGKGKAEGLPVGVIVGGAASVASTPVRNSHDRGTPLKGPAVGGPLEGSAPSASKTPLSQKRPTAPVPMTEPLGSSSAAEASARKKAKVNVMPSIVAEPPQGFPSASTSNGVSITPESHGSVRKQPLLKSALKTTPKPSAEPQFEFQFAPLGEQQQHQAKPKSALKASKPLVPTDTTPVLGSTSASASVMGNGNKAATPLNKTPKVTIQKTANERPSNSQVKSAMHANMTAGKSHVKTSGKKRVKIDLRQNLVHAFGGPVPAPDVRTPSRVTGGILKVKAAPSSAPSKMGGTSEAKGISRGGQQGGGRQQAGSASVGNKQQQPRSPAGTSGRGGATPRAKAALFF